MTERRRLLSRLFSGRREEPVPPAARVGGEDRGPRTAWLAVVQARLDPAAYRTPEAFLDWIVSLAARANAGREPGEPGLIAFPEMIGLGLLLGLNDGPGLDVPLAAAVRSLVKRDGLKALGSAVRYRQPGGASLALVRAAGVRQAFLEAFAQAARETGSFVQSGTALLPTFDEEAALGLHLKDPRVRNVSFLFTPGGRVLASQAKVNLTGGLESRLGLSRATPDEVNVARTPLGAVGTLVCYDAFFESLVGRLDALGAQVLVQPSANGRAWDAPWSADPARREGEEWLRRGAASLLQGRANLRVSLNPMLVGTLSGLTFEGRSNIAVNEALVDPAFLAELQTGRALAENAEVSGYTSQPDGSLTPLAPGVVGLATHPAAEAVFGLHLPLN